MRENGRMTFSVVMVQKYGKIICLKKFIIKKLRPDGSYYKGEFFEGIKQGYGSYQWPDGSTYSGTWINNKRHG